MWRRLPTTLALAGLLAVFLAYVGLWVIAFSEGDVRWLATHYETPAEFRGSGVPWGRNRVLRTLDGYASVLTIFGVLPLAVLGGLVERRRRANVVLALAVVMVVMSCAHFPLFD